MEIKQIHPEDNLSEIVGVLNISHGTVAQEFGFNKENNPTNNAFIDEPTLKKQLNSGIDLYCLQFEKKVIGCIAIEKSHKEIDTFYIEKVSVLPEYRNHGYGIFLMNFALSKIRESGGRYVSIALIDSHTKLKEWYKSQGFIETGIKDFEHLPFRVCFMKTEIEKLIATR